MVEPVSVALNVGTCPATALLNASRKVTVIDEVALPSATVGSVPLMVEFAATGLPALNTTMPSAFTIGVAIESVLLSALVEARVQVETPLASVALQAP